ncbi:MAG: glycosyl transferase group 1 [Myxococcales bacterium]|nr:glycosyl transferase group 1 [Myxococcales bacterium]
MRIGVLTTSYPRDDDDAAGAFVGGFARWLAANVGDVDVVCADANRPLFSAGGAPDVLRGSHWEHWAEALAFSARLGAEAARRARDWDAVVSHWLVPSGAIGDACARGRRHLAIAHGSDVRMLSSLPGGHALVRRLGRRADLVYVAKSLRVEGAPGRVVPMAIDVAPIVTATEPDARAAARARLGVDGFVLAFLGRLIDDKGVDLIIDALPDRATLLIAGEGRARASLERHAAARNGVRFLGHLRGGDKLSLLAAADALCIPSRIDGSPTVAMEALAAGLPVVATRAGGLPELLDGAAAIFCDADARALHAALVRLRDDPSLREAMSIAARAAAPAHDWSNVAPRLWNGRAGGNGCIRTIRV